MARARNIKPGFFANEVLSECSFEARLLFIGLWTLADRRGIVEDRPRRIKGQLFPWDSLDAEKAIEELASRGFVTRYELAGCKCIQIENFVRHQRPHKDEACVNLPDKNGKFPGLPGENTKEPGNFPASSEISLRFALNDERGKMNAECGMLKEECGGSKGAAPPNPLNLAQGPSEENSSLQENEPSKPLRAQRKKPKKPDEDPEAAFAEFLADPEVNRLWAAWKARCRELRRPLKETQIKFQLSKLKEMGASRTIAALEHSIPTDWKGIFEPSENGKSKERFDESRFSNGKEGVF